MTSEALQMDALVLRSYPSGESDNVYRLLTREKGKLSAIAKGVRKSKRRFSSVPEPFDIGQADIKKGRGELFLFNGFIPKRTLLPLRESLHKFQTACVLCEVFDALVHEDDEEHADELFHIALDGLEVINDEPSDAQSYKPASHSLRRLLRVGGYLEERPHHTEPESALDEWKWVLKRIEGIIDRPLKTAR